MNDTVEPKRTPAAWWREKGEPDPHGDSYECERAMLCGGHMSDDEVAYETAMLMRTDLNHEAVLMTAKDRIRWLSRALESAQAKIATLSNIDEGVTQAALVQHFKRCAVAAAISGSDFNQGVVRGLEIAAAEMENGVVFAALRGSQS